MFDCRHPSPWTSINLPKSGLEAHAKNYSLSSQKNRSQRLPNELTLERLETPKQEMEHEKQLQKYEENLSLPGYMPRLLSSWYLALGSDYISMYHIAIWMLNKVLWELRKIPPGFAIKLEFCHDGLGAFLRCDLREKSRDILCTIHFEIWVQPAFVFEAWKKNCWKLPFSRYVYNWGFCKNIKYTGFAKSRWVVCNSI